MNEEDLEKLNNVREEQKIKNTRENGRITFKSKLNGFHPADFYSENS